ncbi:beta-glucosidase 12-like [Cucumis melo]|uniref:Beta-glucosidase 12-like n=1 Tax=Cucumis melo TaxID=3656 RepID=A0ABM3KH99_CUCME|nr:beta-glucosidase 12-like [Cucumis melo]
MAEEAPDSSFIPRIIRRSTFPPGFVFGCASSAYQYEGAAFEYGRTPSIWDTFTHLHPDRIDDGSNADVTVDQYHRYLEDVDIIKKLGFDAYRFSISWSRVLPKGKLSGGVNQEGIDYYNRLINDLLSKGIEPYVTIFHWDVPQALEDEYLGFLSERIINDYRDFAELCFKKFGDRVKHWITFNEQYIFASYGYATGLFAPGRGSFWKLLDCELKGNPGTEPYIVGHNQILAHALTVKLYKSKYEYQNGQIGVTLNTDWYVPYSSSEDDKKATSRALDFSLGWFLHPLVYGDYPASMRELVKERLPKFTEDEVTLVKGSYDFLGINYYTANYAKNNPNVDPNKPSQVTDPHADVSTDRDGVSIGPKVSDESWLAVYPKGLRDLMVHIKIHYEDPIIYITENGYLDYDSSNVEKQLMDLGRVKYHQEHLIKLHESMEAGVKVKGYFAWTLLDDFEWSRGYTMRFGITYVDFKNKTLERIPKLSSKWFTHFLSS